MLDYMLYECSGKLAPESLYPRGLLALLESDRTRNTEYVRTLYTYLQNEMRIPETSEVLYIYRNSFLKRLERIERLLEEDLGDPEVRLHYQLCFALMKRGYGGGAEETHIDCSAFLV